MDQVADAEELYLLLTNAPGKPLLWKQFLARLTQELACDSSFMLVTDLVERENTHFLHTFNISAKYQQQYENYLNRLDIFNYFISKNPLRPYCNQSLEKAYLENVESSAEQSGKMSFRLGLSIPCNHRHALSLLLNRDEAFSNDELEQGLTTLQDLLPTLEESIHAEQRHKINSQLLHHMGERFDTYIIVDRNLNILFADPVYSAVITALDCVQINGDKFGMKNPVIEHHLLTSINANKEETSIHNQCRTCQITLLPINSLKNLYHWECYKDGFILTFTFEKNGNPAIERLTEIYELSRCEAVCALHFMQTPSIPDVASTTCRSQETVRNHIKRTMQKMGVHNQAALMKKLMALSSL